MSTHATTNRGLSINLHLTPAGSIPLEGQTYRAMLECFDEIKCEYLAIYLAKTGETPDHFARIKCNELCRLKRSFASESTQRQLYVRQFPNAVSFISGLSQSLCFQRNNGTSTTRRKPVREQDIHFQQCTCMGRFHPNPDWASTSPQLLPRSGGVVSSIMILNHPEKDLHVPLLIGYDELWRLAFDVLPSQPSIQRRRAYCEETREIWHRAKAAEFLPCSSGVPITKLHRWAIGVDVFEGARDEFGKDILAFEVRWMLKADEYSKKPPSGVGRS